VVGWLRVVDLVAARGVIAVLDVTTVVVTVVVTIVAIVVVTTEKISRPRSTAEAANEAGGIGGKVADTGSATRSATARLSNLWCTRGAGTGHRGICGRSDDLLHGVDHLRRGSTRQQNHRGCRAGCHESQAAVPPGCA
jgi:hypothetical protein